MKVLVLSPPLSAAGGIQRYTLTLVRAFGQILSEQSVRCVSMEEATKGGEVRSLSSGTKLSFIARTVWTSLTWRPDVIICSHLAIGPIGLVTSAILRRPYWVFVYGIEAWGDLPGWKSKALRKADRVIAISDFSRDVVVGRHKIDASRMTELPCAFDEALLRIEPAHQGACAWIPDGRKLILTVARMASNERYKGHDEILNALPSVIAKVPDLLYAIVGGGDDVSRLRRLADSLGVQKNVLFTGEVSDAELVSLYRRSDVFLLPARTVIDKHQPKGEGFGIVYLEAMAFGKPVIGPNRGAPVEVIEHGKTGLLVDPDDSADLAEAMVYVLTHPDEAREMGRAGRERVQQHFSYEAFRERLRELIVDPAAKGVSSRSSNAHLESDTSVLPL